MFDLEKEVAAWSAAVYAERCGTAGSIAELRDHLHCEIDRARAEGMSDEAAFRAAVARLGNRAELATEAGKNRSLLATVCAADRRASSSNKGILLAHALVWASILIASAILMSKTVPAKTAGLVLTCILVPAFISSELIVRAALRRRGRR